MERRESEGEGVEVVESRSSGEERRGTEEGMGRAEERIAWRLA